MTNPLITALDKTLAAETDKQDGYRHGRSGVKPQKGRSDTYAQAWHDGAQDGRLAERGV